MRFLAGFLLFVLLLTACTTQIPSGELPQEQPVITRYEVNPAEITKGDSALITWDIVGASLVTIDPGVGEMPSSGSMQVAPDVTTIYTISATNKAGTVTRSLTLNVVSAQSGVNAGQTGTTGDSKIPTVPVLLSPINGSIFNHFPRTINFRWEPSRGERPITYTLKVQYDTSKSPGSFQGYIPPVTLSNIEYSLDFQVSGDGRWCVMAKNDFGASDYCDWWYFQFTK
jgi:hypothetical protein